jgi:hypothetical protein
MIPFVLSAVAFFFVHAAQRAKAPRWESTAFYFLMLASALVFLGNVGILTAQPLLATFSFPWGAILWACSLVGYGIATWKANLFPRYVGIAIVLLEPGSILTGLLLSQIAPLHPRGAYSAGIEKGLVLALVSIALRDLTRRQLLSQNAQRVDCGFLAASIVA